MSDTRTLFQIMALVKDNFRCVLNNHKYNMSSLNTTVLCIYRTVSNMFRPYVYFCIIHIGGVFRFKSYTTVGYFPFYSYRQPDDCRIGRNVLL